MTMTTKFRTRYSTRTEAEADGWRSINRLTDRDITEHPFFGYDYLAPDGQPSTTIYLAEATNAIGRRGAFTEMFRA